MPGFRDFIRSTAAACGGLLAAACSPAGPAAVADGVLASPAGWLAGSLDPAPAADGARTTILWRSPLFAGPFEFALDEVGSISFDPPDPAAAPAGTLQVRLRGGDLVNGRIVSLDERRVEVRPGDEAGGPTLSIDRSQLESIARPGFGGGSFTGPAGLRGWRQEPEESWREEAGGICTDRRGAEVSCDVTAPPRARFDVAISWTQPSEFRLAVAAAEATVDDAFFLELLRPRDAEPGAAIVRREREAAAIEPLPDAIRGDTLRVVLFVDQPRGRLAAVVPAEGAGPSRVVELSVPPPAGRAHSGRVRLTLGFGDVRLESLRVSPWLAEGPVLEEIPQTVVTVRGEPLRGVELESFDASTGEFVVRGAGRVERFAVDAVDEISFPGAAPPPAGSLRIFTADGGVLSGDLVSIDDSAVRVRRAGIEEPVAVPRRDIRFIRGLQTAAAPRGLPGRVGRLVAPPAVAATAAAAAPSPVVPGSCSMRGCLVGAAVGGGVGWQPQGSLTAAAFAAAAEGGPPAAVLRYVERPGGQAAGAQVGGIGGMVSANQEGQFVVMMLVEDGAAARDGRLQPGDRILAVKPEAHARFVDAAGLDNETITSLLRGRVGTPVVLRVVEAGAGAPREIELVRGPIRVASRRLLDEALRVHAELGGAEPVAPAGGRFPARIVLRSGDAAACRVHSIDGEAVDLETPLASEPGRIRVPADLVRAVELLPAAPMRQLDKVLFERLLTLPRMQRSRPPTHLVRLVDGDYLRGWLEAADEQTLRLEVLGQRKSLPLRQVARVIWLDPPGAPEPPPAGGAADGAGLPVQGVSAGGGRITLVAEAIEGTALRGRSRAFGPASIDIGSIDALLIGDAVGREAGELPYSKWKLRPAPEPRLLREAGTTAPAAASR